jgi:hypothetical protein
MPDHQPQNAMQAWGPYVFLALVFTVSMLLFQDSTVFRLAGLIALAGAIMHSWRYVKRQSILLAFLFFCISVGVIDHYVPRGIREEAIPYTGWVPSGPYAYCVVLTLFVLWAGAPLRFSIVPMLLLQATLGLYDWIQRGARVSDNPYHRISPWRPIWTMAVPLVWVFLLVWGPRIWSALRNEGRLLKAAEQAVGVDVASPP